MFLNRLSAFFRLSAVRLTIGLLLVFAIVTTVAGVGTYWLVQREMRRLAEARLTTQAEVVIAAIEAEEDIPQPGFGQDILIKGLGSTTGTFPIEPPDRPDGIYYFDGRGPEFRYLITRLASGETLYISENAARQDEMLDTLRGGMQVSLLGMLIAGIAAGLLFGTRGQRRLDLISAGLAKVAQGQLGTRIALPGRADDLSTLADRINATTARLEQAMEQMRVQSSNIAHDLRTPLARLRAGIETSLVELTENNQPVDAETLGGALEQIDHIVGTFNALLRLARIESGAGRDAFVRIELGPLADKIAETFGPVIEDAGQRLNVALNAPGEIYGDPELLLQMIANLLQNAIRYGSPGQEIVLSVDVATVRITDQGPGIPKAERDKVLQPLYQLENTRQGEGFGLGLSLVKAISDLHDAVLTLDEGSDGRGLSAQVRFPKFTEM